MDTVDNGGRRLGVERRRFSYLVHIPERRSIEDRRNGFDRRSLKGRGLENRTERRRVYLNWSFPLIFHILIANRQGQTTLPFSFNSSAPYLASDGIFSSPALMPSKCSQVQSLPAFGGAVGDQGSPFRVNLWIMNSKPLNLWTRKITTQFEQKTSDPWEKNEIASRLITWHAFR